jgi:hypothetical protein
MTWLDEGLWGSTGDADTDFPPGTEAGNLYNPASKRPGRLSGHEAEVVGSACRAADAWLHTSQYRVGIGEYLVSMLQREHVRRALTDVERSTLDAADEGCKELQRDWEALGAQLMSAVKVCQAEREGTWYRSSTQTEDCRKLMGRFSLARSRGRSQMGAGVSSKELSTPGAPQPGCLVIRMIMHTCTIWSRVRNEASAAGTEYPVDGSRA